MVREQTEHSSLHSAPSFPPHFGKGHKVIWHPTSKEAFFFLIFCDFLGSFFDKNKSSQLSRPLCRSCYQPGELWILLLHSFAEMKMMGKKQGKIKLYLLLFFLVYFGLHLLQPASQDWPVRRKNTSNHCFAFINTLQSCLLLFDKTVNHLWRQFVKHSEHLDFWRRLEGIGAEVHTFISSKCVSPKDSDFYPF